MEDFSSLAAFVSVVQTGGFAAAARALGITGPAVTKQVQKLEEGLGVRLLNRTTRAVSLTDEGALLYERARRLLEDWQEAEAMVRQSRVVPKGRLKIGAPMSFGVQYLAPVLARFAAAYPDVKLDVCFEDRMMDVVEEGFDLVIRISALKDSQLIARKLAPCPLAWVASQAYIMQHGTPTLPEHLTQHRLIEYSKHGGVFSWSAAKGEEQQQWTFASVMKADNAEVMRAAAEEGIGLTLLPRFAVADALAQNRLVEVLGDWQTTPERCIYALFPANRHLSAKVRVMLDWLVRELVPVIPA
ncbi:LysR family transcriptional regulator [bacterium]|nr:LysR family transcriptional regulator [bacterium]